MYFKKLYDKITPLKCYVDWDTNAHLIVQCSDDEFIKILWWKMYIALNIHFLAVVFQFSFLCVSINKCLVGSVYLIINIISLYYISVLRLVFASSICIVVNKQFLITK